MKVLCVAEKPSIAKSVAGILSNNQYQSRRTKNKYIYNYEFDSYVDGSRCTVVMTALVGHLMNIDFPSEYRHWKSCDPATLFNAPIEVKVKENVADVAENIRKEARNAQKVIIWTDCDLEGEHIGHEVVQQCRAVNPNIQVRRARFSVIQPREINQSWQNLTNLDMKQVEAVSARQELDLRIGAAFTRLQSLRLQERFEIIGQRTVSYGPCQFPTLGFVVERFRKANDFVSENFWRIDVTIEKDGIQAKLNWSRGHLYDRHFCLVLYEGCYREPLATVTRVDSKPKSKWRPLPLTTVELQKLGSTKLRISSDQIMHIAETLYTQGYISYPRTETDIFEDEFDLHSVIRKQFDDERWGRYARSLLEDNKFRRPRKGKNNDKAHPPIHPTREGSGLQGDQRRVFELVARRFLACVSEDAKGHETTVEFRIWQENFNCKGLMIIERNYLEVYPYEQWNANNIPLFQVGERVNPSSIEMRDGKTSPPSLLSEADLISLMDKSGIGTDATIHEHIKKILEREYTTKENNLFCPTVLGMSLVDAYDEMDLELSLSKPELRSQMEVGMKRICNGTLSKQDMIRQSIEMYREAYRIASEQAQLFEAEPQPVDIEVMKCPKCGRPMRLREIRQGQTKLIGCSGYPECKNAIFLPVWVLEVNATEEVCDQCNHDDDHVRLLQMRFDRNRVPPVIPEECCKNSSTTSEEVVEVVEVGQGKPGKEKDAHSKATTANHFPTCVWADQPPQAPAATREDYERNMLYRNRDNNGGGGNAGGAGGSKPKCHCGLLCAVKTSSKETSMGRQFYCCVKTASRCNFFAWVDGEGGAGRAGGGGGGGGGGGMNGQTCFNCGMVRRCSQLLIDSGSPLITNTFFET
ncbi:DNA topoisomerase 3-alpha [Quaeritorhiza haematococci]|nr:DNA topoisomerase 3-alpha [Quaeritorhiza haematococci]